MGPRGGQRFAGVGLQWDPREKLEYGMQREMYKLGLAMTVSGRIWECIAQGENEIAGRKMSKEIKGQRAGKSIWVFTESPRFKAEIVKVYQELKLLIKGRSSCPEAAATMRGDW